MVAQRIKLETVGSPKRANLYLGATAVFGALYALLTIVCPA